eukprot:gb/GEZN01019409.1/.p1 GENE.gb/GEZN01019409.1/~~gb/GEZN01019409.1/.p1  ORF type:complete len:102 (-),score=14.69 gb/GEZN01019409.1/:322-627(-)
MIRRASPTTSRMGGFFANMPSAASAVKSVSFRKLVLSNSQDKLGEVEADQVCELDKLNIAIPTAHTVSRAVSASMDDSTASSVASSFSPDVSLASSPESHT